MNTEPRIIAEIGKRSVPIITRPGWHTGLKEEKTPNTMAMHDPPPSSAENNDTPNTNFGRMTVVPLDYLFPGKRLRMDRKTRARITQRSDQFASNMSLVLRAQASSPARVQQWPWFDTSRRGRLRSQDRD